MRLNDMLHKRLSFHNGNQSVTATTTLFMATTLLITLAFFQQQLSLIIDPVGATAVAGVPPIDQSMLAFSKFISDTLKLARHSKRKQYKAASGNKDGQQSGHCTITSALNQFSFTGDQQPLIAALTDANRQFQRKESIKHIKQRISAMARKMEPSATCPLSALTQFESVQAILNSVRNEKTTNDLKVALSCRDTCPNALIDTTPLTELNHVEPSQLIGAFSAMDWAAAGNTLKKWAENIKKTAPQNGKIQHNKQKNLRRKRGNGAGFKRGFPPLLLILCLSTFGIAAGIRLIDQSNEHNEIGHSLHCLLWLCAGLASIAVAIACCGGGKVSDSREYQS